jgi:Ca-activated chloride channel family protein
MRGRLYLFLTAIICLTPAAHARAQTPTPAPAAQEVGEDEVVRVTTSLVKVPVSVRDREGRYVSDLRREDFRVYDDGAEQRIAHFAGVEAPISVVLLIDVSCSIKKPVDTINAALAFVDQLRPDDAVLPIAFGRNIYALLTESTRDHDLVRERIEGLPDGKNVPCDGGTRLGDAVEFVIHRVLNHGKGRRAVILLTDGRDSKISRQGWGTRSLHDVSEVGVPFYSIRLLSHNGPLFGGWPGQNMAETAKLHFQNRDLESYIDDLASLSGGRSYPKASGETLKNYFAEIGEELRHQYLLEYYPAPPKEKPSRRKIKVRAVRRGLVARARDSYLYTPAAK